jgi:hypothetical protein
MQDLDLRRLFQQRQHQLDQLVLGKLGQIVASHPILESRRDSRVNAYRVLRLALDPPTPAFPWP